MNDPDLYRQIVVSYGASITRAGNPCEVALAVGRWMLDTSNHDEYLRRRDLFLRALDWAQREPCAPALVVAVQTIFDEESRLYRQQSGGRVPR